MIISNLKRQILFLSFCWIGTRQDFGIFKEEFPPHIEWFADHEVHIDLGFNGFQDLYKCRCLNIPHKKPKGKELTEEQKKENTQLSSVRVIVEHSIGGLKRYRILSDRLRMKNRETYDDILGICAGLWNFMLI